MIKQCFAIGGVALHCAFVWCFLCVVQYLLATSCFQNQAALLQSSFVAMKMFSSILAASATAENLSGAYEGSMPIWIIGPFTWIIDVNADFKGGGIADLNVTIADSRFNCPGEKITETDAGVTFADIMTIGDCLGDGIRTDGKDPSKYTITKNSDATLTFNSDGYPALKMTKASNPGPGISLSPTDAEKYIIMEGCDGFLCPGGFEPIMDEATCIEAASAVSPQRYYCDFYDAFEFAEDADRPTGCYTGQCQNHCVLYVNNVAQNPSMMTTSVLTHVSFRILLMFPWRKAMSIP
jgi:hypothetical protein